MTELMGFISQLVVAFVVIGGMLVFGYLAYITLDEFGRDAIKGKLHLKDYLNAIVGWGTLCLMLIFGISAIFFSLSEGWERSIPYIMDIQTQIIENMNRALGGQSLNYTTINTNGAPPQAPTIQYNEGGGVYGEDSNVGGGGYPTALPAIPTQAPLPLPTATIHYVTATPSPAWEAPPLP